MPTVYDFLSDAERIRFDEMLERCPWALGIRPSWNPQTQPLRLLPAAISTGTLLNFMREHWSTGHSQGFIYGVRKDTQNTEVFVLQLQPDNARENFLTCIEHFLEEDETRTILGLAFLHGNQTFVFLPPEDARDPRFMNVLIAEIRMEFGRAARNVLRHTRKKIGLRAVPRTS